MRDSTKGGKLLGNEGAYLPSDGEGGVPKKYWNTIREAAKMVQEAGILRTEKDTESFLTGVRNLLSPNKGLPLADVVDSGELLARYEEASKKPVEFEGLNTGLPTLDSFLLGVQQQNFMVICARTGVGKTLLANYMIAHFASQGEKILYLALEESEMEVGDRWAKIVKNNHIDVPDENVGFLYAETISAIKEDKYNIVPLIAAAAQLGYTMVCVDMLNNLIDTVRDENANAFLNRLIDQAHKSNITLVMTARLRQPLTDKEKNFPTMESVYGRVDLGYIVSKCIGVTALPDEGDGFTYLRLHVLKNRRKQIGMRYVYPKIKVSNLLEIFDTGDDSAAPSEFANYEDNPNGNFSRTSGYKNSEPPKKQPKGDTEGLEKAGF